MEIWRYLTSAFKGVPATRKAHEDVLATRPDIISGIDRLQELMPAIHEDEGQSPIFLFSAGWRSGSTLLQRLLMSDSDVFIWGESYDHCGLVQALAGTTRAFTSQWPPESYYYDGSAKDTLSDKWIADLYPPLSELRKAHRAFFDRLFAYPAREAGARRWGLKEVRLGIEHASYLKWLYPDAKFLFLYRNPLDAYRSYCRYGRSWYDSWPDGPVFTPTAFGTHWRGLVEGFIGAPERVNGLVVSYEDLIQKGKTIDAIERYLDVDLDRSVMSRKVGSSTPAGGKIWVSRLEKWLLKRAASPVLQQVGYEW